MKDEELEIFQNIPDINEAFIYMKEANEPIIAHEGLFVIKNGDQECTINGIIEFDWFPNSAVVFFGISNLGFVDQVKMFQKQTNLEVSINGQFLGFGFFTNVSFGEETEVKGIISRQVVKGERSIQVKKISFSIPNFKDFVGDSVKYVSEKDGMTLLHNRIILENDKCTITLDKSRNYKNLQESLQSKGGYVIQYSGELVCKKGSMSTANNEDVFNCLDLFLSFINGRRTSAMFLNGVYENKSIWCDYSSMHVDPYKNVFSWTQQGSTNGLNDIWKRFCEIWNDKGSDGKNFLNYAIHWYLESNSNSGFIEGSIVISQTALELIYNWLIIENKKILIGKDSENISAANKIRLLLSQLGVSYDTPTNLSSLKSLINQKKDYIDAPDAIVQIRNAIVHSQEEKRKKLNSIPSEAKFDALELCLWYIELSLLYILGFDGIYNNRCDRRARTFNTEHYVPWAKADNVPNPYKLDSM